MRDERILRIDRVFYVGFDPRELLAQLIAPSLVRIGRSLAKTPQSRMQGGREKERKLSLSFTALDILIASIFQ